MPRFLVQQFMSHSVLTIARETPLIDAARQMSEAKVSCAVVCDNKQPVGVVTERDVTRAYADGEHSRSTMPASQFMSDGVYTLEDKATCTDAMDLLEEHKIRRLVVTSADGTLAGVITQSDLLRAHTHNVEQQKVILEERVAERTKELEALTETLTNLSRIDPMLEIGNRRAMDEALIQIHEQAVRYDKPYSVAIIDVDFFKPYNDNYGHGAGDEILKTLARSMKDSIRGADAIFRYGGEEFLAIYPEVTAKNARIGAERLRTGIESLNLAHEYSNHARVTVSIGIADSECFHDRLEKLLSGADAALYTAKNNGRNRTEVAQAAPDMDETAVNLALAGT